MSGPYETWTNQICRFITLEGMKKTSEKRYQQVLFGISCWWSLLRKTGAPFPSEAYVKARVLDEALLKTLEAPEVGGTSAMRMGELGGNTSEN